ncbi:sericin-1-like [Oncorhynchus nerka]|uniref:sericin-1-like n=1 Tax=Oncorhynchus nerka TaxID=8023 RepID=UPI0031B88220
MRGGSSGSAGQAGDSGCAGEEEGSGRAGQRSSGPSGLRGGSSGSAGQAGNSDSALSFADSSDNIHGSLRWQLASSDTCKALSLGQRLGLCRHGGSGVRRISQRLVTDKGQSSNVSQCLPILEKFDINKPLPPITPMMETH